MKGSILSLLECRRSSFRTSVPVSLLDIITWHLQREVLLRHVTNAFQVSLTALHGRTFFEEFGIGSTLAWVAAIESVCGLIIEVVFTSMLVQRFFSR